MKVPKHLSLLFVTFLSTLVLFVLPSEVSANNGMQEVICGHSCWGSVGGGWIEPEKLPPGIGGGIRGGDGGTCSLNEALAGCTPDDIHISPCAGAWCDGDEGTDEESLVCDFYCIRFPNIAYHYVGEGDPWGDPGEEAPPAPAFDCQLAWDDPGAYPDWPSGC